jgi:hypothetical protein
LCHRLTDGAYIPVQAKGRSALMDGEVHLVVWADSLAHDEVMIVSGLLVEGGLGPMMLAVASADLKRLAEPSRTGGRPIYSMGFGMRPRSDSRWLPWLVPPERLAERFGVSPSLAGAGVAEVAAEQAPSWRSDLGPEARIREAATQALLLLVWALNLAAAEFQGAESSVLQIDLNVALLGGQFVPLCR